MEQIEIYEYEGCEITLTKVESGYLAEAVLGRGERVKGEGFTKYYALFRCKSAIKMACNKSNVTNSLARRYENFEKRDRMGKIPLYNKRDWQRAKQVLKEI